MSVQNNLIAQENNAIWIASNSARAKWKGVRGQWPSQASITNVDISVPNRAARTVGSRWPEWGELHRQFGDTLVAGSAVSYFIDATINSQQARLNDRNGGVITTIGASPIADYTVCHLN